jgi:hypothetical protein
VQIAAEKLKKMAANVLDNAAEIARLLQLACGHGLQLPR